MTTTQYNSNNRLTPEFKRTSFEKEIICMNINIQVKAEERSVFQISFRTQDPNLRQTQAVIRDKNYS